MLDKTVKSEVVFADKRGDPRSAGSRRRRPAGTAEEGNLYTHTHTIGPNEIVLRIDTCSEHWTRPGNGELSYREADMRCDQDKHRPLDEEKYAINGNDGQRATHIHAFM